MRILQPGWIQVAGHDPSGRRGLWYRGSPEQGVELCAGREGDDCYVCLPPGQVLTAEVLYNLWDCLATAADNLETSQGGSHV